jgi:hypothetical protein
MLQSWSGTEREGFFATTAIYQVEGLSCSQGGLSGEAKKKLTKSEKI